MTVSRDPDRLIQAFLREAPVQLQDRVYDAVRADIDVKRQRVFIGPWRLPTMYRLAMTAAAAAAVLVVAVVGYNLLPRLGIVGPGATASPTPPGPRLPLLARGVFQISGRSVSIAAIAAGSSVTGRMTVSREGLDVDLQCTLTTEDGLLVIGGFTSDTFGPQPAPPLGTPAAIVLKRGSPVQVTVWSNPESQAATCLAFLDEQLALVRSTGGVRLEPISGFVELGSDATPVTGAALLARGDFVTETDEIDIEATGAGDRVTGRMTVGEVGSDGYLTVDLQCSRTTEDGLIMIGGYIVEGGEPAGTQAAIFIQPGPPVQVAIWSQRGGDTSAAPSCLAYLDDQLRDQSEDGDFPGRLRPLIEGTVELAP